MIWVFIFCLWPPDKAGRKSGCGAGRPAFLQEMKTSASNSTPSHENEQVILLLFGWCYSQVEGDPLSKRTGLSSMISPGSLDSGAGALNNAISPVSWSPWPYSSSSSFTAFFVQLVLEDDKIIMTWCLNDYINSCTCEAIHTGWSLLPNESHGGKF